MVECEYCTDLVETIVLSVLIDTWWNVNTDGYTLDQIAENVLIDTWWNVNERK